MGVQKSGKHYYEVYVSQDGISRVGWATQAATLELGTDRQGFGYGGTAKAAHDRKFTDFGETYGKGDYVGCCLDIDAGEIGYTKNGKDLGIAFTIPKNMLKSAFYPCVCLKNAEVHLNFGATAFQHLYPGYTGVQNADPAQTTTSTAGAQGGGGGKEGRPRPGQRTPKAIIIEPARELAEQTHKCMIAFSKHLANPSLKCALITGGSDPREQMRQLGEGCDVVTGTPGRLLDLMESGKLHLGACRFFCLDEADRLLDTGNLQAIMKLYGKCPKLQSNGIKLQTLMFRSHFTSHFISHFMTPINPESCHSNASACPANPNACHVRSARLSIRKRSPSSLRRYADTPCGWI